MSNILKFPSHKVVTPREENPFSAVRMLGGMPDIEFYEVVFTENIGMLGLQTSHDVLESLEFFEHPSHPHQVLVDIGQAGIRGLYMVDLQTFVLEKISDEPLLHFK
ncbi:MAG: hypothetical protein C0610_17110 [Desulfobacteraceae bacterium]|nr:MAG: hypothetical protein C0610_17110 [Desulfobacteraceae bacterium]